MAVDHNSNPMSRSRARRIAAQTLHERDLKWKEMIDSGQAFELNEDCIRAHVLFLLGVLNEVEDLPVVLQARIAWEQLQEGATGQIHPNIVEARKRVAELKKEVESSKDETNLEVEDKDGDHS
jgi:hypothetical protein